MFTNADTSQLTTASMYLESAMQRDTCPLSRVIRYLCILMIHGALSISSTDLVIPLYGSRIGALMWDLVSLTVGGRPGAGEDLGV